MVFPKPSYISSVHYDAKGNRMMPTATAEEKDDFERLNNGYGWMLFYKELNPEMQVPYMRWDGTLVDIAGYVKDEDRLDDEEPDSWVTINGNHIPLDENGNPIGGQPKAYGGRMKSGSESAMRTSRMNDRLKKVWDNEKPYEEKYKTIRDTIKDSDVGATLQVGDLEVTKVKDVDDEDVPNWAVKNSNYATWSIRDVMHVADWKMQNGDEPTFIDREARREEVAGKIDEMRKSGQISGSDEVKRLEEGHINATSKDFGKPGSYVMYRTGAIGNSGMLFFAPKKESADTYASLHDSKTGQYTCDIKKPLIIRGTSDTECVKKAYEALHPGKIAIKKGTSLTSSKWISLDKQNATALPAFGYDALIYMIGEEPREIQIPAKEKSRLNKLATYSTTKWSQAGSTIGDALYTGSFDKQPEDYNRLDGRFDSEENEPDVTDFYYFLKGWCNREDDEEPASWITLNGNHIPLDSDKNPIGGQPKAYGGGASATKRKSIDDLSDAAKKIIQHHKQNPYHFGDTDSDKALRGKVLKKELNKAGIDVSYDEDKYPWPYSVCSAELSYEDNINIQNALNQTVYGRRLAREDYIQACRDRGVEPRLSETPDEISKDFFYTKAGKLQHDGTPVYRRLDAEKLLSDSDIVRYSGNARDINPTAVNEGKKAAEDAIREMTDDEHTALYNYTKNFSDANYAAINRCLATGEGSEKVQKAAKDVVSGLNHDVGVDCICSRGTNSITGSGNDTAINKLVAQVSKGNFSNAAKLKSMLEGKTITSDTVISTSPGSALEGFGSLPVQFIFKTPKDARGVNITELSAFGGGRSEVEKKLAGTGLFGAVSNESEVAFRPGTKYTIERVEFSSDINNKKKNGQVYIVAKIHSWDNDSREDEDDWVTINGTHVLLNEEGVAQGGGKLAGKTFSNAKSQKHSKLSQGAGETKLPEHSLRDIQILPQRPRKFDYDMDTDEGRENYESDLQAYKKKRDEIDAKKDDAIKQWKSSPRKYTTKEQVNEWGKKYDVNFEDDVLDMIDPALYDDIVDTQQEMFERFPQVKKYQDSYRKWRNGKSEYSGVEAIMDAGAGINFTELWKNADFIYDSTARSMLTGYTTRGDGTVKTLIRHEFGHHVDSYCKERFSTLYDTYEDMKSGKTAEKQKLRDQYKNELEALTLKHGSEYAKTNDSEAFAEGFSEWSSNPDSEYGKAFGEFLGRWMY